MTPRRSAQPVLLQTVPRNHQPARMPSARLDEPDVVNLTVVADDRLLLTVEEAARRLSIGRTLCYELVAAGQIRTIRVGRLRRRPRRRAPRLRPGHGRRNRPGGLTQSLARVAGPAAALSLWKGG